MIANNLIAKATKSVTVHVNFQGRKLQSVGNVSNTVEGFDAEHTFKPPPPPPPPSNCALSVPFPYDNRCVTLPTRV
jgi:hypothetical protein